MNKILSNPQQTVILTIDVEDWFQVENFKSSISYDSWESRELRVEQNTHLLLDLLDSVEIKNTEGQIFPKATFFILGWIAERLPNLVREIAGRGHEIACHGHMHHLCSSMDSLTLRDDILKNKILLEDIIGEVVVGYRAPSFDIDQRILDVIQSCGFLYDSSYNSFGGHARYGHMDFSPYPKNGFAIKIAESFYELPVSNLSIKGKVLPWGGGGYFRLIPLKLFIMGVSHILKKDGIYLYYTHPWEFDPEQPKVHDAPASFKFRHYVNLKETQAKLSKLMSAFSQSRFITCRDYIEEVYI